MGLLANLVESYQTKLNKDRIDAGLKPLKFDREEKAWETEARIKADLPVNVNSQTKLKILRLSKDAQKDIARYRHIFKNSPEIVEMYVDKLSTASSQEELVEANEFLKSRKNINLYADKKDFTRWSDLTFYGKQRWDMIYRPETKEGKKAFRKYRSNPVVQLATGVSVGTYNALAGTAELGAALSDVIGISDDMIGKVEKALPAIDLMDVYGESRGSIAKMTSVLVQYGLGFGVARQIAKKLIKKVAKTKLGTEAAKKAASVSLLGKTPLDIASFGGYWVLPAALGDATVSSQANITLGDIFGDKEAQGKWHSPIRRALANSKRESLEGLSGKERSAAILRNKLKFAGEGAAIFGGMTLVGPSLKAAAWGTGKVLAGQKFGQGLKTPLGTIPTRPIKTPFGEISRVPGAASLLTGVTKGVAYQTKARNPFGLPAGIGVPLLFRKTGALAKKLKTKLGIPDYEHWKFSQFDLSTGRGILKGIEAAYSRMQSNFKFGKQSGNALRKIETEVRRIRKLGDGFIKDLDRQMYKLAEVGFKDIAMQTVTSQRALGYWDDVIKFMRGEIKVEALPKSLRTNSRILRKMVDDQTEALQPILKDKDLKETLVKNMKKYLHTSYQIFKNSKFTPPKQVQADGVEYFMNMIRPGWKSLNKKSAEYKELLVKARLKVDEILTIGRNEGSTPGKRMQTIANAMVDINVPANIFKAKTIVPDEIARLLGRVENPKNIILDTLAEQAHTLHSYNAYRDLARFGMGKWLWKNTDEYAKWAAKNGIMNPRSVHEIVIRKPYNIDLESIFKNKDGSSMVALPEMAKAISDNTILMDALLKIPFMKTALMMKAGVQMNKTVLSLMTQMRNITTASLFALANGHVGVGASVADNFEMLFKELIGKTKDPKALRDLLDEALEAGALDSSTIVTELEKMIPEMMGGSSFSGALRKGVGEITEAAGEWNAKLKRWDMPTSKKLDEWTGTTGRTTDQIFEYLFTNKGLIGRVVQKSMEAYQLGDNVWKLFGYQFTKSQLRPAFKNLDDVKKYFREVEGYEWNPYKAGSSTAGTGGRNLKTLEDAHKEVAGLIVRDVYPNYSMVPRVVQNIRGYPFVGNFVGFTSEMWRNSWHMVRRGMAEVQSSNPFIRQMGARRLIGFGATVGTLGPVALNLALDLTGIKRSELDAWKLSFAPEFMTAHNVIPITGKDKDGNYKAIDFDAQHPYSDVQMPFAIAQDNWKKGKHTDQNSIGLFAESFGKAIMHALKPFSGDAIWWETFKEIMPQREGQGEFVQWVSRNKTKGILANWTIDDKAFEKVMAHVYKKILPTTLKSGEKIVRAMQGQVTSWGARMNPEEEIAATVAGVRVVNIKPLHDFDWKQNQYLRALSSTRQLYYSDAIKKKENLRGDIALIKEGHEPEFIPDRYNHLQQNRYRYWSLTFKDIENLRKMDYTEKQIEESLKGRGAFSKKEIKSLMLGLYMPTDMKEIDMSKDRVFASLIKDLNKELGTNYTPSEVFDVSFMKDIEKKWDRIPLNLDEVMRNYNFTSSTLFRLREYKDQLKETQNLKKEQGRKDLERRKEELKKQQEWNREKREREKLQKSNLPIGTPNVSSEVIASKPAQNTVGSTGLTATETAWLSNEEKAMRLKSKGLA
jgi:hypothetical protein